MQLLLIILLVFLVNSNISFAAEETLVIDERKSQKYGFKYSGITEYKDSVDFIFYGVSEDLSVSVIGFDIDLANEVKVLVNGNSIGFLDVTGDRAEGESMFLIPASLQNTGEVNVLSFEQRVSGWMWGVTDILLFQSAEAIYIEEGELNIQKYGYKYAGIYDHRDSVKFVFQGSETDIVLKVLGFDIDQSTEVSVEVNGHEIGLLNVSGDRQQAETTLSIPESVQIANELNTLVFRQRVPGWMWGITDISLMQSLNITEIQLEVINSSKYGYKYAGSFDHRESVHFSFASAESDLILSVKGFDIDQSTEVSVEVNGTEIGFLSVSGDRAESETHVVIPLAIQNENLTNTLSFKQRVPGWMWGVTDILIGLSPDIDLSSYKLAFSDEFNSSPGSGLDSEKWDTALLWGPYLPTNGESQMYVDTLGMHENFHFSPFEFTGSTLKISATPTNNDLIPPARPPENDPSWQPRDYSEYRYNGPTAEAAGYVAEDVGYLSGIITSYDSFKTTHGYFEMRAKLPAGKGLWPAFWLLNAHYVEDVPEIDVMEFLGGDLSKLYNTYHYFDIQDDWRKVSTPSYEVIGENWTQNFHTFGLGWSPTEIIWYVDGQETNRVDSSEFKISGQAMYLVANLAVGGNWAGEPDSSTSFPAVFEIDYIRAYKKELQQPPNLNVDYQLVFEDEFDGAELDRSKWNTHFLWGPYLAINNEEQYYVDALGIDSPDAENSPFSLSEGILKITGREASSQDSFPVPLTQPSDDDAIWDEYPSYQRSLSYKPATYTSGLITSYDSFKFTHGYVDIRAKLPKGDGLWPAFWLLNSYYISQQPEIDIMEFRGRLPNEIVHSYHRLEGGQTITNSFTTNLGIDLSADYHDFGVSWEPGILQWFLDGVLVGTYESPDVGYQLMYLIANLAIGGDFDPNVDVDISKFPATLEIDHIKVYQAK